jgi:hypothetical protein
MYIYGCNNTRLSITCAVIFSSAVYSEPDHLGSSLSSGGTKTVHDVYYYAKRAVGASPRKLSQNLLSPAHS